jgi:hypothetical protein
MDEDDIDPDEIAPLVDGLGGDLADVRDELQLQVLRLSATFARAQIRHDMLPLDMEGAVHGDNSLDCRSDRRIAVQRVSPTREEGRVAFDLDQVEVAGGIDHLLDQSGGDRLGMAEAHPMGPHVVGIAADVGDEKKRLRRGHVRRPYSSTGGFKS